MGGIPFFSILALMLSVFGASYTALNAIRNHFGAHVKEILESAKSRREEIKNLCGAGSDAEKNGIKYETRIVGSVWWWNAANLVPVFLFVIMAFGIAVCVIVNWDHISSIQPFQSTQSTPVPSTVPSPIARTVIILFTLINALCLFAVGIASWLIYSANKSLEEHVKTAASTMIRPISGKGSD